MQMKQEKKLALDPAAQGDSSSKKPRMMIITKAHMLMLISYLLIKTPMIKKRRLLKLFERKKDKRVTLWVAKKEAQQSSTNLMKCLSCDRADHAIPSVLNCLYPIKSKTEFTETLAIKANLNNTCKDANMILKVQKLVPHLTLVVYAGILFANHF